jgi:TBC1 domain family member 15
MMNFDKDQVGMHTQLTQLGDIVKYMDEELYKHLVKVHGTNMFFCFRWLLILFKREYLLEHVKRIWEVIWANHYGPHHHLFICLAMLLSVRSEILTKDMEFDDVLRVCFIFMLFFLNG